MTAPPAKTRPRILLTNDDGVNAPGLHAAYRELKRLGEVTIVAPDAERSAVGHAITTITPLRVQAFQLGREQAGWAVSGMPADCVKIGVGSLLPEPPDVVVSGVNLGPNVATNIIYSGTVSAATEARILGLPSIAVSLGSFTATDFAYAARIARKVAALVIKQGLPERVLLNVNVPARPAGLIKGIRVCRQGSSAYAEEFAVREDPRGQPYYWLAGSYTMTDSDETTDAWALANGYVAITPVTYDLTAHHVLDELARWPWPL